jgi:regulator of sirC expression with transglutaminase-like and TPR domain
MTAPAPSPSSPARAFPRRFEELSALPDDALDVALGAALIAQDVHAGLNAQGVIAQLDEMAAPLVSEGLARASAEHQAARLAAHVYGTLGFRGNEKDYYDPRNSLLSDVVERRMGIPITLAIVYCEIARRAGVPAHGVGFPGHFLVRIERPGSPGEPAREPGGRETAGAPALSAREPLFIDPFYGGRSLDEAALTRMVSRALGQDSVLKPEHLVAASSRAILMRVLTNLKAIYLQRGDHARAHLALDRIVTLAPNAAGALKERGLVAAKLGAAESAREDLSRVLELDPSASDAASIRAQLAKLAASAQRALN